MSKQHFVTAFCLTAASLLFSDSAIFSQPGAQQPTESRDEREKKREVEKVSLKVEVEDPETARGIRQAQVFVSSDEGGATFEDDKRTDRNGFAHFSNVPKGTVVIKVIAPGYKTATEPHLLELKQNQVKIQPEKDIQ
jgi:hypothetical protein